MNEKHYIGKVSLSTKVKRSLWNVVRFFLFRPFGTKVFRVWRLLLLKLFGAKVSWKCDVYASAKVWAPWNLVMEEGSCIGPEVICYNQAKVVLKKNACVSQNSTLCTAGHGRVDSLLSQVEPDIPLNNAEIGLVVADIVLEEEAWVGMQAFVGMGVTIGSKSVVGARANVFKDVSAYSVVYAPVGNCTSL